jgi:hypothetical protein
MSRRRLPQPLEPGEVRALLDAPARRSPVSVRNRTMVALMAESGLRVSEVTGLRRADLSEALDRLRVVGGKGGDRFVPLSEANAARLRAWLAVLDRAAPGSAYVFPQLRASAYRDPKGRSGIKPRGSRLSTAYVRAMTRRLGAAAGVVRRTNPHALRHTAATAMLEADYSVAEVQAVLGHRSLVSTSVYLHVRDERLSARLRGYRPAWEAPGGGSPRAVGDQPSDALEGVTARLPTPIRCAYQALQAFGETRARAFVVLWLAGYEPVHARVLAMGPTREVDQLWIAAGRPDAATLGRMVGDRRSLDAVAGDRPA